MRTGRVAQRFANYYNTARRYPRGAALVMTPEVRAWLYDLRKRDRASAIQVGQAIGMLLEAGP